MQQLSRSERMLNDLMGNLPGVVYRCLNDKAWTMLYLSEKCFELTGYNVEDLLGNSVLSFFNLIHPDDAEIVNQDVQKALNLNEHFELNYRIITADNLIKWVLEKGKGIYDDRGKLLYLEGLISDITKTKESEIRYRESIEFAVDGILIGDMEGNIIDANTIMQQMTGYNLEEVKTKHISNFFAKDELESNPMRFDLLNKGETVTNVRHLVRPDGRIVPIEMHSKLMPNFTFQAIVRDVSERIKTEQLIRESEEKFRTLAETSAVAIMIFQGDFWVYSNPAGERISGYPVAELLKMHYWDFVHPDDKRLIRINGERVGRGKGKKSAFEFKILTKKGELKWVFLHGDVLEYKGMSAGLLSIIDITEQKSAEINLKESEKKYRNLFEKSKDPTLLIDNYKFIDCNSAAVDILRYKNKKEVFNTHPSLLSPKFQPDGKLSLNKANEMMNIALKRGSHRFEWVHITKTGAAFTVDVSLTRIPVEGKEMLYTVWRDISEQKLSEKRQQVLFNISNAALASENLEEVYHTILKELGSLMDIKNFFIALYDEVNDILSVPFMIDENDDFKVLPPNSLTAYVIKKRESLVLNRDQLLEMVQSGLTKFIGTYPKIWMCVPIMHKEKAIGAIVVQDYENEHAFHQPDLELLEFVSNQIGISIERKLYEDELKRAFERASESDRLKSAFLATMSHELRTPLNAIIGFSELINENLPIEDTYNFASTINKSGNHLLEIVEDIFDITLIETGEVKIHKTNFNLHSALEDIFKILKSEQLRMINCKAEIKLELPNEKRNLTMHTDRQKFNQILINLLKNALKFTPNGTIEFGYSEELLDEAPILKFYVKDTGIGIHSNKKDIIFDMFRQADETYTREYGGVGIGLSLTKKLTELLGGKIWFESEVKIGSTFYFTIIDYKPEIEKKSAIDINDLKLLDFSNRIILVVEDVESSYTLMEVLLSKLGAKLLWAKNGKEAVEQVKENLNIDLVLMDVNMPVMNGYEATGLIKKLRPDLPVIAQTAYAIAGDREKALAAGCNDYLEKPIRKNELYKIIELYLND